MILIRPCAGFDELEACVQLQIETWGYDESDMIPRKAFLVAQKIGGQVIGAFDTELARRRPSGTPESLVGFAMSLPGVKTGENSTDGNPQPYLHSHMLAVRDRYRNRGLGAQLKLEQRREALSRGIRRMEWTFDPLEIKNAYLNIHKLGAIVRRYFVNFYGVSSSRLQGGLPTDRLVAEWQLDSPRVQAAPGRPPRRRARRSKNESWSRPPSTNGRLRPRAGSKRLPFSWRIAGSFKQAFSRGLAVVSFDRDCGRKWSLRTGPLDSTGNLKTNSARRGIEVPPLHMLMPEGTDTL